MTSMDRLAELALIGRLRRRDQLAFDEVYAAWNARLFSFLIRLSRRREVAEDLLEETWLRVVEHAHRLREDTHLGPWLYTIARNLYVSHCRARLVDDPSAPAGLWPAPALPPSPFDTAAHSELERRLERAIASLPASAREVVLLVGVEGLTPAEAAIVCGIRPEALRQRLSRARALLAERLEADDRSSASVLLREVLP